MMSVPFHHNNPPSKTEVDVLSFVDATSRSPADIRALMLAKGIDLPVQTIRAKLTLLTEEGALVRQASSDRRTTVYKLAPKP